MPSRPTIRQMSHQFHRVVSGLATACVLLLASASLVGAHVVRIVIDSRQPLAGGKAFGAAGAYERVVGRVFYAFDPKNPHNRQIADLALAPRNEAGDVEAWGEIVILRPVDPAKASGLTLVDVVNRGGQTTFVFNLGARRDLPPDSAESYGDAFLFNRGVTVVAVGWQFDVPAQASLLHFSAPPVGDKEHPVTGLVRADATIDAPTRTMSLGHAVATSRVIGYPVADPNDVENVLTVRDDPAGQRRLVPRSAWRFAREERDGTVVDDPRSIFMRDGFQPGKIYEAVYRAKDPVVVGAGMAAVRDVISFLKHDPGSPAPTGFGMAYGVSQTGRFLRHFLYQGFNTDEQGRRAFDAVFAHTAGAGRGSFNHRFAQPSRDAQPYTTFFYPTDVFPVYEHGGNRSGDGHERRPGDGRGRHAEGLLRRRRLRVPGAAPPRSRTRRSTDSATCRSPTASAATSSRRRSTRARPHFRRPRRRATRGRRRTAATCSTSASRCARCSWRSPIG